MADVGDRITDTRNADRPNTASVASTRAAGGTSLTCDDLTGWPTASKVHFVTYQVDTNSDALPATQLDCTGIVSGSSIGSLEVIDGTDAGNTVGDVVEMLPTAAWGQDLADALTEEHDRTGAHTDIAPDSVTTDSLQEATASGLAVKDSSGNEYILFEKTASAVNQISIKNAAASSNPQIKATGGDTNIGLNFTAKGTGLALGFTNFWAKQQDLGTSSSSVTGCPFAPKAVLAINGQSSASAIYSNIGYALLSAADGTTIIQGSNAGAMSDATGGAGSLDSTSAAFTKSSTAGAADYRALVSAFTSDGFSYTVTQSSATSADRTFHLIFIG